MSKVVALGAPEELVALVAAGVEVRPCRTGEELEELLESLADEADVGLLLVAEPVAYPLLDRGNDWYAITYNEFDEMGEYRILIYGEDYDGLQGRPRLLTVQTGWEVYLPLVLNNH